VPSERRQYKVFIASAYLETSSGGRSSRMPSTGDSEIWSLVTRAYNGRLPERQTLPEQLGRLIHVPGTVWQLLT
jgi:hypothetical protein